MRNPAERVESALQELLQSNKRTKDRVVGDMFFGRDIFVVSLKPKPLIVEGLWEETDSTVDILDLMDMHMEKI